MAGLELMRFHYSMGVEHCLAVVDLILASGLVLALAQPHTLIEAEMDCLAAVDWKDLLGLVE